MAGFFETKIEFLKGVGPQKAALLNKELNIYDYKGLLQHYPFRYEDRSKFYTVSEIDATLPYIQAKGQIKQIGTVGAGRKQRLVAIFADHTGEIELVWFKGIQWVAKKMVRGMDYVVFGKPNLFGSKINIAHPEIEPAAVVADKPGFLQPVYHLTEKLRNKFLDSKAIAKLQQAILKQGYGRIKETLPIHLLEAHALMPKKDAMVNIHFPKDTSILGKAQYRLKFEELFLVQLRLLKLKVARVQKFKGQVFKNTELLTKFYEQFLPFPLTGAQKRVIKEVYHDMKSGAQMNRLLQGDVGSGKTIVAFICLLVAVGSGAQGALMAPTEILAIQHYHGLKEFADQMGLNIALLTGSTKKSARNVIHEQLLDGSLHILVGTHALIEDKVNFNNLGLAIVDEQHRFGVAQRSKLWKKNEGALPHVLVMTATPIPRTLAMTLYGDLDVSVIDELPANRKPIKTVHRYDANRLKVNGFLKEQIAEGRQAYIVYPLIDESEKLDLKHLMDGYESICRAFPGLPVSIVHGKMKPADKDFEMQRFVKGETKIMVATTVIEVGVNVPNASVMVIENAERFGLAQLHQLRGRVGRGASQSYCILITSYKLSKEGRQRIDTMVRTNNGFEIADADLKLRGPGDLMGTQQSGVLDLMIADLGKDANILQAARAAAQATLEEDPNLEKPMHQYLKMMVEHRNHGMFGWERIS